MKIMNIKRDNMATRAETKLAESILRDAVLPDDVRAIVIITTVDGNRGRGGMAFDGYDDDATVMVDLLAHLQALGKANGIEIDVGDGGDS